MQQLLRGLPHAGYNCEHHRASAAQMYDFLEHINVKIVEIKSYICCVYMDLHAFFIVPTSVALRGVRGKESSLYSTSLTAVRVVMDNLHFNNM
jgi:hypothetical protein